MMSNKTRNRLIGVVSVILICLIISPYIITDKTKKVETTIPLFPPTDSIREDNTQQSQLETQYNNQNNIDNAIYNNNQVDNQNQQEQINRYEVNTNINSSNDKNYIIQLVALKNKQKIDELTALLRLNNYEVYTIPQVVKDGQITRLMVGNYQTREQAELVIIDLENLTKLKGYIALK